MKKALFIYSIIGAMTVNSECFSTDIFNGLERVCPNHKEVKQLQQNNKAPMFFQTFKDNLSWHVDNTTGGLADALEHDQSFTNLTNEKLEIVCVYSTIGEDHKKSDPVTLKFELPKISILK